MNSVVLVGRIVRDPELRYIPESGTPVTTFALAVERDFLKKDGETRYYTKVSGNKIQLLARPGKKENIE